MANTKTDNKTVAQKEAEGAKEVSFTVTINGRDLELTAPLDPAEAPYEYLVFIEENKIFAATRALLGDIQCDQLRRYGATGNDFINVIEAYGEATEAGE